MPPREVVDLFDDIIRYGNLVGRFVEEVDFNTVERSSERFLAIERGLQVVAEAFTQAQKHDPDLSWRISDAPRIIAFRHLLTHHYYKTSPLLVWSIATANVPILVEQISLLIQQPSGGERLE